MKLEYTQDDIDAYVKGELDPEQHSVFAKAMKENPALLTAVAEARFALDVADELLKRDLRAKMRAWDEEKKTSATPPPPNPALTPGTPPMQVTFSNTRRLWWAAAAVAVLAVATYFLTKDRPEQGNIAINQQQSKDTIKNTLTEQPASDTSPPSETEKINSRRYAINNFQREQEKESILRGGSSGSAAALDTVQRAQKLFFEGKYDSAIILLKPLKKGHPNYLDAQITLGDAYFKKGQFAAAEKAYEEVEKTKELDYTYMVDWNLLLAYLAQYPEKKTKFEQLKSALLKDKEHPQRKKIEELGKLQWQ